MGKKRGDLPALPTGEQPVVERVPAGPVVADTFAGRIHVEWDNGATVTPLGQLPFFVEYLKQGGSSMAGWRIARCTTRARTRLPSATFSAPYCCRCWPGIGVMRT